MADDESETQLVDLSLLKDLGDIVRAKNLFFVPFFGTFLFFLVTQSTYVINANIIVQLLIFVTFVFGVWYASVVSNYLWTLEMLRFSHSRLGRFKALTQDDVKTIKSLGTTFEPNFTWEGRLFRCEMICLWITTCAVLFDIYFGKPLKAMLPTVLKYFGFS